MSTEIMSQDISIYKDLSLLVEFVRKKMLVAQFNVIIKIAGRVDM